MSARGAYPIICPFLATVQGDPLRSLELSFLSLSGPLPNARIAIGGGAGVMSQPNGRRRRRI